MRGAFHAFAAERAPEHFSRTFAAIGDRLEVDFRLRQNHPQTSGDRGPQRQAVRRGDAVHGERFAPVDVEGDRAVGDDPDPAAATDLLPQLVHPAQGPRGDDDHPDAEVLHLAQDVRGVIGDPAVVVEQGAVEVGRDQTRQAHAGGQ